MIAYWLTWRYFNIFSNKNQQKTVTRRKTNNRRQKTENRRQKEDRSDGISDGITGFFCQRAHGFTW